VTIAYLCSAWPSGSFPSGISGSIGNIRDALRRQGVRPFVLADRVDGTDRDPDAVQLGEPGPSGRWVERVLAHVAWRIANRFSSRDTIVQPWLRANSILREVRRLKQTAGLQLLEMEESFGWARFVARRSPVPLVVRLHGPLFLVGPQTGDGHGLPAKARLEGVGIRRAHAVSAPSQDTLEKTQSFYRLRLAHAEVIPNAVVMVPQAERWRPDGCDPNRILFVGRFDRLKGGDLIIDAFARVLHEQPECRLTFVGPENPLIDDAGRTWRMEEFLDDRFPDPSLRSRVERLGRLTHREILPLRQRSMVTAVCSRYETFGNVVVEAMACGCPLVAPEVGGIPEIVQDGRNGLLFRPGDAADLAVKILTLLGNPSLAEKLGRQGAVDCSERYDPEKLAEKTIAFYRQVIERWNHRRRSIW